jgi:rSAM/selenodomain-associated transferase 1
MSGVRTVVFAKAPFPGLAKTRLIPALGIEGAARLARRMLAHTLNEALSAKIGPVELCVTPSASDAAWQSTAAPDGVVWSEQGIGDLGARLARASARVIGAGESVLLIGADCPELGAVHLRRAARWLQETDSVVFPTADGGYALLGLNRFHPLLFERIPWSTDTVAFETLRRIGQLGWTAQSSPMLHDIDEPADLRWLPQDWQKMVAHA